MKGWVAGGYYHPLRIGSGQYDPLRPEDGPVRAARRPPSESVIHSPRLRYVPEPTLMLLHALEEVTRSAAAFLATLSPERLGLFVDPGESWLALQQEFFSPVITEGPPGASPMLFPHTSEASAASLAAINAGLRGPCLVLQASPGALLSVARQQFRAGLLDGVVIAAIHYGAPARAGSPPPVDCAAAALFDRALGEAPIEAPERYAPAASLGDTGPCAWLFAQEAGHG